MDEIIFSKEWLDSFGRRWNNDAEMVQPLAAANFSAVLAFGFVEQANPTVLIQIDNGRVTRAGLFNPVGSPKADWDLRSTPQQWEDWKKQGLSVLQLGVAVSSGKLQFKTGDYRKMIRSPSLAAPFLRFFKLL